MLGGGVGDAHSSDDDWDNITQSERRGVSAAKSERQILGRYIVADPRICHGKPTFRGTRVMVWQVLFVFGIQCINKEA
jgi:Protein of unknown function (DUF433)